MLGRRLMLQHPLHAGRNELSEIAEYQLVRMFHQIDLAAKAVVLMCDAIVKGFSHHPGVIARNCRGEQGAIGHVLDSHIADATIDLVCGQ